MPDVGHEQNLYEAGESLAAPLFTTRTGTKVLLRHIDQEFLCLTIFSQVHYAILRIVQYSTVLTMLRESSVLECFALAKHFGKLIPVRLIPTSPPSLLKLPGQ
jgi:hypothetical protein